MGRASQSLNKQLLELGKVKDIFCIEKPKKKHYPEVVRL
jgi:hypothetical protein